MLSPLPRRSHWWYCFALFRPVVPAFPVEESGSACASSFSRIAQRSLALRPHAHSQRSPSDPLTRRLQPFRHLHVCSGTSGWSGCRVGFSPTGKAPPFHGALRWRPAHDRLSSEEVTVVHVRARCEPGRAHETTVVPQPSQEKASFHRAVAPQLLYRRPPRANPSVKRTVKRLRLLSAAYLKR